jgi:hypothetical protein
MEAVHDRASRCNNFQITPLSRPRIEHAVDCAGVYVICGDHGWLFGDRRSALREFETLERIERRGSA